MATGRDCCGHLLTLESSAGKRRVGLNIEDADSLVEYLQRRGLIDRAERPVISILNGGVSNRVVLVTRPSGEAWVLKQALAKLRVEVDWFSDPARTGREAIALQWLTKLGLPVPRFRFEDPIEHLLSMDAVPEPHENWKSMLLAGRLDIAHVEAFAQLLANLHCRSRASGPAIALAFEDRSYFESLRIEPYYIYTAEQLPAACDFLTGVVQETRANRVCLVHGDFSPKNVLIHDNRLVLLDHEVTHFGDPAFDIGFSMAHLLSKANHLREYRSAFLEAALLYWATYRKRVEDQSWSRDFEPRAVRSILACLLARVAGRSQLEYLDRLQKDAQQHAVLGLMSNPPATVSSLVNSFVQAL